jgi:uncharacterized metal-binding protein YceD (DUF177 family)
MENNREFLISFSGLSLGHHNFELKVDNAFFEGFEYSEVKQGDIDVTLDMEKTETFIMMNFSYSGQLKAPCDRCLEDLIIDIKDRNSLIVKFGEQDDEENEDEIIFLSEKEHEVDVSKFVYDSIILAIPAQKTHETIQECNQDMIAKMGNASESEENKSDPRWDALKGLKFED